MNNFKVFVGCSVCVFFLFLAKAKKLKLIAPTNPSISAGRVVKGNNMSFAGSTAHKRFREGETVRVPWATVVGNIGSFIRVLGHTSNVVGGHDSPP